MKKNDVIFLLGSSVLLVFAWIVFNIIHQSVSSTITETIASDIRPIQSTFDTKTIEDLKARVVISPDYSIGSSTSSNSAIPTTIPTPTFAPAPLATTTPQVATSGGTTQ
ncbi:MAG TPA: hypothetical protein VF820_05365 [Patescibacteria group bacterium]